MRKNVLKWGEYMLDKNKVRIMTKMAIYEKGEGKEYLPISKYYKRDYVGLQMMKSFICSTIAFAILFLFLPWGGLHTVHTYTLLCILPHISVCCFYFTFATLMYMVVSLS